MLGALLGFAVAFIATVIVINWAGGRLACEADEAAGCGFAAFLYSVLVALLLGSPMGAVTANSIACRLAARKRMAR